MKTTPSVRFTQRLTYANVVSTLCLLLIVVGGGGAAYALGQNTVGSPQIKNGAVKTIDLGGSSVTGAKIKTGTVSGSDLVNGSVGSSDIGAQAHGVIQVGMHVNGSGVVVRSFNRLGAAPTVTHPSTGRYLITVPGAAAITDDTMIALATSRNYLVDCRQWDVSGGTIEVVCYRQGTDTFTNTLFDFVLIKS
jgi:hypothetical protein